MNSKEKELIKNVLYDYPQNYLLYHGGGGGEFLSYLISEYSSKFRKIDKSISMKKINRTQIPMPIFFETMSLLGSKNIIDNTVEELYNIFSFKKVNIEQVVEDAIFFLEGDIKPPLLRCHQSLSSYFNNKNSYTMLIDSELWWNYGRTLFFLKEGNKIFTIDSTQDIDRAFSHVLSTAAYNDKFLNLVYDAMDWVIKNNLTVISSIQLDLVRHTMVVEPSLTFEKIFHSSPNELFEKYGHIGNNFYGYENFRQAASKRGNAIKYSKIFTKGYLEKMFDIESDNFHLELIAWHERNLVLMAENEFDVTPYKINGVINE